ncbi:NUDIX hydrolase [Bombilactobacillus thymidiniphilus]|uniref:NUDIX hydrolase n=1 Tax=Bombilactobacillus thymidiniphilus TaxID=2923363 RepID=A0ABY4PDH2_9LACO|nr:NUDIX hydrolase [Bombilactobacillus thymidiniphilus]UQS83780.1 NUDIX hydrolase [Bombilactobacillus thymidiniphilus]
MANVPINSEKGGFVSLKEQKLTTKRIFTGQILNLDLETVRLPNGATAEREVVHHHGAVAVLAVIADKLLLVRQWREPMQQITLEIPAGKIDPGKQDLQMEALRELNEETGYQVQKLTKVAGFYSTPGFSDEYLTIFQATGIKPAQKRLALDSDEFVEIELLTFAQVQEQIQQGIICDAKTLLAIFIWQQIRGENN